jgi:hypothetical protein
MIVNRLYVSPTEDTLSYLSAVMAGAPIDIDPTSFKVEVISTEDALEIDPERVYVAQAINVNVFYDSYVQRSSLIATLVSGDLQERARELNQEGVVRAFYDWYIPYLVIKRGTPPLSRHFRTWKVSLANAICQSERPLQFTGEYVEQEDLLSYPDFDYISSMAAELQLRHNANG